MSAKVEGAGGMRCGQCGRKLTAAAQALGYCPSCGNHLNADESARFSVVAEESGARVLPQPVGVSGNQPAAAPTPAVLTAPGAHAPVTTVTIRRRNPAGSVTVALLLIAFVAGGALIVNGQIKGGLAGLLKTNQVALATATPHPTATATLAPPTPTPLPTVPPAPSGFTTFTSQDGAFGCNYPVTWSPNTSNAGTATSYNFTAPNQQDFAQVTENSATIDPASVGAYLQTFVNNSNGANFTITEPANQVTVNHITWMRAQATFDINGQPQRVIGFAANHGGKGVIVIYTAPTPSFQIDAGAPFTTMVNSFTFLR